MLDEAAAYRQELLLVLCAVLKGEDALTNAKPNDVALLLSAETAAERSARLTKWRREILEMITAPLFFGILVIAHRARGPLIHAQRFLQRDEYKHRLEHRHVHRHHLGTTLSDLVYYQARELVSEAEN